MGDHQVLMAPSNSINITCTHSNPNSKVHVNGSDEKKARPHVNCPRCNSSNTKFCYYNNYSLTQPRYFCKNCRRYWTEGGSLRNVPVGGGSRKNKRAPISVVSSSKSVVSELNAPSVSPFGSSTHHGGQDLSLSFPTSYMHAKSGNDGNIYAAAQASIQNPSFVVPGGFAFQELKPSGSTIGFGHVDGIGINGANNNRYNGYNMFPFEGDQNKWQGNNNENNNNNNNNNPSGYWSGLLGGGSW